MAWGSFRGSVRDDCVGLGSGGLGSKGLGVWGFRA